MSTKKAPLLSTVAPNLIIGDIDNVNDDKSFLVANKFSLFINLSGMEVLSSIETYEQNIPNDEWVDNECAFYSNKIWLIVEEIYKRTSQRQKVFMACNSGRNSSPVVAGAYLIRYHKMPPAAVITLLETIFFTPDELETRKQSIENHKAAILKSGHFVRAQTHAEFTKKCLTNNSFRKFLLS